ncbi:MAG TPA: DNA polymerase III subunit gamma/tau [Chloroflexota bacterium]
MSGQALYRRWRPRTFADVVGQEHVTRTLRNAVRLDRVAHGYLFCGPRGVAKTSTARILAKAINCLDPRDGEPCDQCDLCRAIGDGTSYDVIEMDAASNGLVDNVRDLRQHVLTHPDQARRKVYILDEAHRMSAPAFDALLKTLEEPPAHVVFILVTSEPERIPATIASRCQRFDFRRLAQRGIVGRLREICQAEGVTVEPAGLDLIARAATGSMRDAQSILDQLFALGDAEVSLADVEAILGSAGGAAERDLAGHVIRRDQAAGLRLINQAVADGADPRQLCRGVTDYLRGLLLLKLGGADEALDLSPESLAEMQALAAGATVDQLLRATRLFGQAEVGWRGTLHFQLPLELAFVEATLDAPPAAAPPAPGPAASRDGPPAGAPAAAGMAPRPAAGPRRPARDDGPAGPTPGAQPSAPPSAPARAPAAAAPTGDGAVEPDEPPLFEPDEAAEPRPAAPAALTLDRVVSGWPEFLKTLGLGQLRLALDHTRLRQLMGNRIVLETLKPELQRLITSPQSQRTLETQLAKVYGQKLRIGCETVAEWTAPAPEAADPILDDPLVKLAVQREWRVGKIEPVQ